MKENRSNHKGLVIIMGLCLSLMVKPLSAFGETGTDEPPIGFSYQNIRPKNQQSTGDYFDVLVKPSDEQILATEVSNETQNELTIKVTINDAKTTEQGLLAYGPNKLKSVSESRLKLTDVLDGPSEVTLKKGETKKIEFKLKMPKKPFKGVLLGGIQLQEVKKKEKDSEHSILENEYAYLYSVSVRETVEKADLIFSHEQTYYEINANGEEVKLLINNDSQEVAKELALETQITAVASGEVVAELKREEIKMAPNSVMTIAVPFTEAAVGKYQTRTTLKAKDRQWEFETAFEIKNKDASGKETQVEDVEESSPRLSFFIIVGSLLIGTGVLYAVIRQFK